MLPGILRSKGWVSHTSSGHDGRRNVVVRIEMNEPKVIAALYRCDGCRIWWSSQELNIPEAQLIFRMAEQHKDLFPWEEYQGWRAGGPTAAECPKCSKKVAGPKFLLTQSEDLC